MIDRLRDAAIEEFRLFRAIEIPVEISSIVKDLDIAIRRWSPFDEVRQGTRVAAQGALIVFDPVEHDRGDGEHDSWAARTCARQEPGGSGSGEAARCRPDRDARKRKRKRWRLPEERRR